MHKASGPMAQPRGNDAKWGSMAATVMLGVDVSKATLDAAAWQPGLGKWQARRAANGAVGARELVTWLRAKAKVTPAQIRVVLEATGPYHEEAAEAFHAAGCEVVVANPKRVRDYARGLGLLTKTDAVDARTLAGYGEQNPAFRLWTPPAAEVRLLKALVARLSAVDQDLQRENNRLEKALATATPAVVLDSLRRGIQTLQRERQRLERELDDHIDRHPGLKQDAQLLQTIPGIGATTARRLLCLLRGRAFGSARQAAAFVGLAVVMSESGTSVRSRPALSKRGDPRIRAGLYFPAIVASQHNPPLAAFYRQLVGRGKTKMAAIGALMRKLVHLAYGVLKHQTPFNANWAIKLG